MTSLLENCFLVQTIALSTQQSYSSIHLAKAKFAGSTQLEINSQKQNQVSRLLFARKTSNHPSKFQNLKLILPN